MDPSAFIFVGLAVAWAAYLIPKALEHHDAGARSRTVDKFSHSMRVLARREAVDRRNTRLVTGRTPASSATAAGQMPEAASETAAQDPADAAAPAEPAEVEQTGFFAATIRTGIIPAQDPARRSAAAVAARRRRRVLGALLVLTALVGALVAGRVVSAWWIAAPLALLAAWLVACRVMVTNERAARRSARRPVAPTRRPADAPAEPAPTDATDETTEVPAVRVDAPSDAAQRAASAEPIASGDGWELVPVTLPTYVSKPAARRQVGTIDLDSTGVWTSGRTAADSALAQQADAVRAAGAAPAPQAEQRRVSGA